MQREAETPPGIVLAIVLGSGTMFVASIVFVAYVLVRIHPGCSSATGAYQLIDDDTVHEVVFCRDSRVVVNGSEGRWSCDGGVVSLQGVQVPPGDTDGDPSALILRSNDDVLEWNRAGTIGEQKLFRIPTADEIERRVCQRTEP